MAKFIHTSDWHLGMTRHFFSEGAQERFAQARFASIKTLGEIAKDNECEFIVVSGDVFESNFVNRKVVLRALEALKSITIPVYILPGNHDPYDDSSVYNSGHFNDNKSKNVHLLDNSDPIKVSNELEIIGVPWKTKRPIEDLFSSASSKLEPSTQIRICVAHGMVDSLSPESDNPSSISLENAENAIEQKIFHYIALGDRHSATKVGSTNAIWYSGAPEPTDFNEIKSGLALIVEINQQGVIVEEAYVGKWVFKDMEKEVNTTDDIKHLESELDSTTDKENTVLKLKILGTLSLNEHTFLEDIISKHNDIFAAIQLNDSGLVIRPNDDDFNDLELSGFANNALNRLRHISEQDDLHSSTADDALKLLVRLWSNTE